MLSIPSPKSETSSRPSPLPQVHHIDDLLHQYFLENQQFELVVHLFSDDMIIQMSGKDETDVVYTINEGKALRSLNHIKQICQF